MILRRPTNGSSATSSCGRLWSRRQKLSRNDPRLVRREWNAALALDDGNQSDERRVGVDDHACRDRFEIGADATLAFEARAKLRLREVMRDARHDAAREKNATAPPKQQRQVACHAAEHGAKHFERRLAHQAGSGNRRPRDLGGVAVRNVGAVKLGNCAVEILQAGARQSALSRYASKLSAQEADDSVLALRIAGQVRVTALARD